MSETKQWMRMQQYKYFNLGSVDLSEIFLNLSKKIKLPALNDENIFLKMKNKLTENI